MVFLEGTPQVSETGPSHLQGGGGGDGGGGDGDGGGGVRQRQKCY